MVGGAGSGLPCLWGQGVTELGRGAGGPVSAAPCGIRGLSVKLSRGPLGPPCPTWWSPAFLDLSLTHADPAPHLASIWGWHSGGGEEGRSHLAGEIAGSPGGQ